MSNKTKLDIDNEFLAAIDAKNVASKYEHFVGTLGYHMCMVTNHNLYEFMEPGSKAGQIYDQTLKERFYK